MLSARVDIALKEEATNQEEDTIGGDVSLVGPRVVNLSVLKYFRVTIVTLKPAVKVVKRWDKSALRDTV